MADEDVIRLVDLEKTLDGRRVLKGLSLDVRRGETMVVIGRSGVGKSVTLKHIVGLMRPDRGQVLVGGEDLGAMTAARVADFRRKFGLLFQSGALINWLTVGENVALPLVEHERLPPERVRETVLSKLALVDMVHAERLYPSEISGGMKKRAGLARAIVRDPEVVLYDEPTSGLDPVMSNQINELILDMQRKIRVTSLVVTHDMESAYMIADRIAMLFDGRIIQVGTPAEIKNTQDPIVRQFIDGDTHGPITDAIRGEEVIAGPEGQAVPVVRIRRDSVRALRVSRRRDADGVTASPTAPPVEVEASPTHAPTPPDTGTAADDASHLREEVAHLKARLAEVELSGGASETEVERRLNESILRDLGGG